MRSLLNLLCPVLCSTLVMAQSAAADEPQTLHEALYTETPITVDGKLDEPVWQKARSYPLNPAWRFMTPHIPLSEGGVVRLAWDDEYLYLAAELEDSDVVAEGKRDHEHHYRMGDVLELFLRPPGKSWYWELYGTPHSLKTAFFYPSRGRVSLPSSERPETDLKVAAVVKGTLNNWQDQDEGWTLEMAIALKDLGFLGDRVGEGAPDWRILVSRYNFSVGHEVQGGELSSTSPAIKDVSFHNFANWGTLRFVKPEAPAAKSPAPADK